MFSYLSNSPTSCECVWTLLEILSFLLGLSSLSQSGHHFCLWISLESPWRTFFDLSPFLLLGNTSENVGTTSSWWLVIRVSLASQLLEWIFLWGCKVYGRWNNLMNFGFDIVCQKLMSKTESWYSHCRGSNQKEELFRYLPLDCRLKCSLWSSKFWISTTPGKGICRSLKQRWITSGERSHDERNGLIDGVIDRPLKLLQIFWSRCSSSCFFDYPFLMCEEWTYLWSWAPKS